MGKNKGNYHHKAKHRAEKKQKLAEGTGSLAVTPEEREKGWKKNWKVIVKSNEAYESYYKATGVVPPEEWETFLETLRNPLPTTFRITIGGFFDEVKQILNEKFTVQQLTETVDIHPPKPISWYPDQGAWSFSLSRKELRSTAEFEKLHQFLLHQTNCGTISRQEAVSMIPPLFLAIEPHHRILDMCAAPGSKTAQIIEFLHSKPGVEPTGLIIANDNDAKRAYTLTHQIGRLGSPCAVVSCHDAESFPALKLTTPNGKEDFQFDRILADVPCSSDGTLRKNVEMWSSWVVQAGIGLHKLQFKIAMRGAVLLKVGGRMVYSTCSMNPIEDEAVVSHLLKKGAGALRLVDVSAEIPHLKRLPGINSWKVQDRNKRWFDTWEDVPESDRIALPRSMFPPTEADAKEYHLERCMRITPHLQDTGGFFIAVLEKVAEFSKKKKPEGKTEAAEGKTEAAPEEKTEEKSEAKTEVAEGKTEVAPEEQKKNANRAFGEELFRPIPPESMNAFLETKAFYGLSESFPINQAFSRTEKAKMKHIYFMSKEAANFIYATTERPMKVINAGIRAFNLHEGKGLTCCYRLSQDGIQSLVPYMTKRVVHISEKDMINMLNSKDAYNTGFSEKAKQDMEGLIDGSVAFLIQSTVKPSWNGRIVVGWKGRWTSHLLLAEEDMKGWQNRLFLSDPHLLTTKVTFSKKQQKDANTPTTPTESTATPPSDATPTDSATPTTTPTTTPVSDAPMETDKN